MSKFKIEYVNDKGKLVKITRKLLSTALKIYNKHDKAKIYEISFKDKRLRFFKP